jgi:phage FluMu protein Com
MKRMFLLRCARCNKVVVDAYAEYSPERNQFWCKNCIGEEGYLKFRSGG